MSQLLTPPAIAVITAAFIAAVTDIRHFKIHNTVTIPLFLSGIAYQMALGGVNGLMTGLIGAAAPFAVLLVPYVLGALGAGDLKLMMGFGAWLGAQDSLVLLAIGLVGTAVYSFAMLIWQRRLRDSWATFEYSIYQLMTMGLSFVAEGDLERDSVRTVVRRADRRRRLVPFSVMAAVGLIMVLFFGDTLNYLLPRLM